MKFIANLFLILLFVPVFILCLTSSTVKYKFLDPVFWKTSFNNNNVYPGMSAVLKDSAETQVAKSGGNKNEAQLLTGLITPANLKDIVEKNITNFLNYVNGKAKEIIVYVPLSKIPKGLLPVNLGKISEEMTLTAFLEKFNMKDADPAQLKMLSSFGRNTNYFFVGTLVLLLLFVSLLFLTVDPGKRLIGPGLAFTISGLSTFGLIQGISKLQTTLLNSFAHSSEPLQAILKIILPSIINNGTSYWKIVAGASLIFGIALLLVKRPVKKSVI